MTIENRITEAQERFLETDGYAVVAVRSNLSYTLIMPDFPGCVHEIFQENREQSLEEIEETALAWIAAAITQGQEIPPPTWYERTFGKGDRK